jgi:copper(I)-binding protein
MNKMIKLCALLAAALLSNPVYAGGIQVEGAWSRATAPGQDTAMVDMTIVSEKPAKLTGFATPVSQSAEMHSMTHDQGMMKMREVKSIELPAGRRVNLGEAGFHLMLIGLRAPLKAGENLPLTLNVQLADHSVVKIEVKAEVKPLTDVPMSHDEHMHHMHH